MINRKGFTLVELLAVLVVLAVISTIAFPIVGDMIDTSEEKAYEQIEKTIKKAAKNWETDNSNLLIEIDENDEMVNVSCYITLDRLKYEGYLENVETIDPMDDSSMDLYVVSFEYDIDTNQYYNEIYMSEDEAQSYLDECPYPESE